VEVILKLPHRDPSASLGMTDVAAFVSNAESSKRRLAHMPVRLGPPLQLLLGSAGPVLRAYDPLARARVVVEFNLPSAETGNHAPAVVDGKVFDLGGRHRFQNRELGWVGDKTFRFRGKNTRYLVFDGEQVRVHR
jgi:hypothetical protein